MTAPQVRWDATNSSHFVTGDYDGAVALWDLRSAAAPLQSRGVHDGKVLALEVAAAGAGDKQVLSGGSDCSLSSTNISE